MRVKGFRGRGGGPSHGGRPNRGIGGPSRGRRPGRSRPYGRYESRDRYEVYESKYGGYGDWHEPRKRSRSASGGGYENDRYEPDYYSGRRLPKGWNPAWEEQPRHYDRKRMRIDHDSYDEAPRYHETRHPPIRSQHSPRGRDSTVANHSRRPPPSHSPRVESVWLRGRGRGGLERGRFIRRGGVIKPVRDRGLPTRKAVSGRPSQVHRGLLLRRKAVDYQRQLLLARNRRLRKRLASQDDEDEDEEEEEAGEQEKEEEEAAEEAGEDEEEGDEKKGEKKEKPEKAKAAAKSGASEKAKGEDAKGAAKWDKDPRKAKKGKVVKAFVRTRQRIRLHCPHCSYKALTFVEYNHHLGTSRHLKAEASLSSRIKVVLSRMRINQRRMQRVLEKKKEDEEDGGNLSEKSSYCSICKLLFRNPKAEHEASEMHKLLSKFLQPYCVVCRTSFKSPVPYEKHLSSLFHIKKKARAENWKTEDDVEDSLQGDEEPPEFDEEFNPDTFMTVDSVGDVDDEEMKDETNADKTAQVEKEAEAKPEAPKPKAPTNVSRSGEKYVKKLEVFYCELCKKYLPRIQPLEKAVSRHCLTRVHVQNYWLLGNKPPFAKQAPASKKEPAEKQDSAAAATPDKEEETATPSKEEETATPSKEGETTTPSKEGETTTPSKEGETTTPSKEGETTTPSKEGETTTPSKEGETTTPSKEGETDTPDKEGEDDTSAQDAETASPAEEEEEEEEEATATAESDAAVKEKKEKETPMEVEPKGKGKEVDTEDEEKMDFEVDATTKEDDEEKEESEEAKDDDVLFANVEKDLGEML